MESKKAGPVAFACSCALGIEQILSISKELSKGTDFILIADNRPEIAKKLAAAYINVSIRRAEGTMRAGSQSLDMLLLLSGTMKISQAITLCGAKNKNDFIVFATTPKLLTDFATKAKIKKNKQITLILDPETAQEVAMTELLSEK